MIVFVWLMPPVWKDQFVDTMSYVMNMRRESLYSVVAVLRLSAPSARTKTIGVY